MRKLYNGIQLFENGDQVSWLEACEILQNNLMILLHEVEELKKKVMPLGKGANTEESEGTSAEAGV